MTEIWCNKNVYSLLRYCWMVFVRFNHTYGMRYGHETVKFWQINRFWIALGYFFPWRTTYFHLNFIVLKVISFILVTFRSLKKILTELSSPLLVQIYQTKIHEGVVPSNLTKYGKCITVNDGLTYILDKESNKKSWILQ
jgi:hypothetical protein